VWFDLVFAGSCYVCFAAAQICIRVRQRIYLQGPSYVSCAAAQICLFVAATCVWGAGSQLGVIDTATSSLTCLSTGYSSYGKLAVLQSSDGLTVVTVAGSPSTAQALVKLQVKQLGQAAPAQYRCDSTQPCRHYTAQRSSCDILLVI
jgi:hypothetical protein